MNMKPALQVVAMEAPETVNWHVIAACNYSCKFCYFTEVAFKESFATEIQGPISLQDSFKILEMLRDAGANKITFAGGEPTLYRPLPILVRFAHELGLNVNIVSNGTGVTAKFLDLCGKSIKAVKISVDSGSEETEIFLGRGRGNHIANVLRAASLIKKYGIEVMTNTVVTSLNYSEDLHRVIKRIKPSRWKVFQVLPINGQNSLSIDRLAITTQMFQEFVNRHRDLSPVAESNEAMTGSYVMMDPVGRFFQNWEGTYRYSRSTLKIGVFRALSEVGWSKEKFLARGGSY